MNKPPRKGDLVENGSGTQGIVVSEQPCGDPTCAGEIQVRLVQTPPGTQPLCYLRREVDVIAPAGTRSRAGGRCRADTRTSARTRQMPRTAS